MFVPFKSVKNPGFANFQILAFHVFLYDTMCLYCFSTSADMKDILDCRETAELSIKSTQPGITPKMHRTRKRSLCCISSNFAFAKLLAI